MNKRKSDAWLRYFLPILCGLIVACQEESGPSPERYSLPRIYSDCIPSGRNVSCTATLYDVPSYGSRRDVTSAATWLVSDPSLGSFAEPGLFSPIRRGEVGLWARYDQWEAPDQSWFFVDPNKTSQRLYFLSGQVLDATTEANIVGAKVEILDGYSRGKFAITNEHGSYHIERVLISEEFFVRASKSGFHSLRKSYRVDSPIGPSGNAPFLNFFLRKRE